jgi:hypothetical protein
MASRKLNKADTGIAGQSALIQYQKKSSKKKAKRIQLLGARLGKIANTILGDGHQAEAWEKGAIGEQAIGALLDKLSLELSFKVLQSIKISIDKNTLSIDNCVSPVEKGNKLLINETLLMFKLAYVVNTKVIG